MLLAIQSSFPVRTRFSFCKEMSFLQKKVFFLLPDLGNTSFPLKRPNILEISMITSLKHSYGQNHSSFVKTVEVQWILNKIFFWLKNKHNLQTIMLCTDETDFSRIFYALLKKLLTLPYSLRFMY